MIVISYRYLCLFEELLNVDFLSHFLSTITNIMLQNSIDNIRKRMLMKRQEDGMTLFDSMPSRIQRIAPLIIQHIESLLYLNARSRDEYSNKKTLKKRLQRIRNGLTSSSETVGGSGSGSTTSGNNVETE